ncbi:MAG: hypothetical protein PHV68_06165 [Candidatus Gastranaerophilales bacterium]|nr:hypothetical protein [Candidatus Gastranaerophilales bacterium]
MRGYKNFGSYNTMPGMNERIISVLSYLTAGMVGFFWIVLSAITKRTLKQFVKFHTYQSIFLSILYYVAKIVLNILLSVIKIIPIIGKLFFALVFYITQMPFIFGFSILHTAIIVVLVYIIISCLKGKYTELPWVSENIRRMI